MTIDSSDPRYAKAVDAAGWEETHTIGRIGSEAAEVAVAAFLAVLAEEGVVLTDQRRKEASS